MQACVPHQKKVMTWILFQILSSEVSTILHYQLCSTHYIAVRIKNSPKYLKVAEGVSKDEWKTKEDTVKSMKIALHIMWYAKGPLGLKWCSTVTNQAYSFSLSQSVSQSHLQKEITKQLFESISGWSESLFGLVLSNPRTFEAGLVDVISWAMLTTLWSLLQATTVVHDALNDLIFMCTKTVKTCMHVVADYNLVHPKSEFDHICNCVFY